MTNEIIRPPGAIREAIIKRKAFEAGRPVPTVADADNANNSDPERLAKLDPEQAAWFRQKYAKAREVLTAAVAKE